MSSIERHIRPQSLAVTLAKNPKPHRHAHAGPPITVGEPLPLPPTGKWPDPIYAARRAGHIRHGSSVRFVPRSGGARVQRGLTVAQQLIESWYDRRKKKATPKQPHLIRIVVATDDFALHKRRSDRVPIRRLDIIDRSKYPGAKLRELRKDGEHR